MILTIIGFLSVICILGMMLFGVALGGKDSKVVPAIIISIVVLILDIYLLVGNLKVFGYVS